MLVIDNELLTSISNSLKQQVNRYTAAGTIPARPTSLISTVICGSIQFFSAKFSAFSDSNEGVQLKRVIGSGVLDKTNGLII